MGSLNTDSASTLGKSVKRWPRSLSLIAWLTLVLMLAGCSSNPLAATAVNLAEFQLTPVASLKSVPLAPGGRLQVVATTSIVGDVVAQVGGGAIDLLTLMPRGVDPHTYEPTPGDIQAIAKADIVFLNGLGLEETLLPRLANAGGQAALVSLSEGITPRGLGGVAGSGVTPAAGDLQESGVDPHVWQDPQNVIRWTENAADALSRLDPAGEQGYRQRADAYRKQLEQLDATIQALVDTIPLDQRRLVTDHDDMGYFAARYGFTIVGAVIPAYSTSAEPSAREISQLEDVVKQLGVKAVFVSVEANQVMSSRVAQDTGVRLVPIYAGSLSPADGPAPSYIKLMLYNVNTIVEALK
jgi:manganese/iron transport system substrate-binding protein